MKPNQVLFLSLKKVRKDTVKFRFRVLIMLVMKDVLISIWSHIFRFFTPSHYCSFTFVCISYGIPLTFENLTSTLLYFKLSFSHLFLPGALFSCFTIPGVVDGEITEECGGTVSSF